MLGDYNQQAHSIDKSVNILHLRLLINRNFYQSLKTSVS